MKYEYLGFVYSLMDVKCCKGIGWDQPTCYLFTSFIFVWMCVRSLLF